MRSLQHYTRTGWRPRTPSQKRQADTIRLWHDQQQLEVASRVLTDAENNLRFAVGRYIHDNTQQQLQLALGLLRQQADLLAQQPEETLARMAAINERIMTLLTQANEELSLVRHEVLLLQSPHATGLHNALAMYLVDDFPRLFPDASFTITADLDALAHVYDDNPAVYVSEKMLVSYFVREALRNAYKHAHATTIHITATRITCQPQDENTGNLTEIGQMPDAGEYMQITVADDGRGFDVATLPQLRLGGQHCSFYEFDARAAMLGGFTQIVAEVGGGTDWMLFLPVPETPQPGS